MYRININRLMILAYNIDNQQQIPIENKLYTKDLILTYDGIERITLERKKIE